MEELGSFKNLGNLVYDDKLKTTEVLARMVWNWFKWNIFTKQFVSFTVVAIGKFTSAVLWSKTSFSERSIAI